MSAGRSTMELVKLDGIEALLASPNPVFAIWQACFGADADFVDSWRHPRALEQDRYLSGYVVRSEVCERFTWAVPAPQTIDLIAFHAGRHGIVEAAAGTGYWAAQLAAAGVDVICCDDNDGHWFKQGPAEPFHSVLRCDAAEFAAAHAHRTLLLVWPPYDAALGADVIEAYWRAGGQRVVYVGEDVGGCCGDERMHQLFDAETYDRDIDDWVASSSALFRAVTSEPVPQWSGIHDYITIYDRRDFRELTP